MKTVIAAAALLLACGRMNAGILDNWHYNMPETGLLPSYVHATYLSSMRERHGGTSHLGMQKYALTLPLADPRQSGGGGWMFNAQIDFKMTLLDTEGSLALPHDELYQIGLPLALIRPESNGNRLTLGLAPEIASDLSGAGHCADLALFGEYRIKANDRFTYGVGVGISPRFATYGAVPFLSFEWKPDPDWNISLKGYRLSALYQASSRWSIGPFIESTGGIWMVETDEGDRVFRIRSCVVGVTGEYDFAQQGQRKRIITVSLGSTVATTAEFCDRGWTHDAQQSHHYRPGLYAALGVDFRF